MSLLTFMPAGTIEDEIMTVAENQMGIAWNRNLSSTWQLEIRITEVPGSFAKTHSRITEVPGSFAKTHSNWSSAYVLDFLMTQYSSRTPAGNVGLRGRIHLWQ